jgi:hypothetical protein
MLDTKSLSLPSS